jgi:hypothetical protein
MRKTRTSNATIEKEKEKPIKEKSTGKENKRFDTN